MINDEKLTSLIQVCDFISQKGYSPATGGNFSIRIDNDHMAVSGSGRDKRNLTKQDFVLCDLTATLLSGDYKPSDEAVLHGKIYQLSTDIQCVLHTHSVPVTVLSMLEPGSSITINGFEMQKTIAGHPSHESPLTITILENSQDIPALADQLQENWDTISKANGFIVRGHGLYTWGKTIIDAKRHMEGTEFLVACLLEMKRLQPK